MSNTKYGYVAETTTYIFVGQPRWWQLLARFRARRAAKKLLGREVIYNGHKAVITGYDANVHSAVISPYTDMPASGDTLRII